MTPEQITIRILLDILADRGGISWEDRDRLTSIMDMPQMGPQVTVAVPVAATADPAHAAILCAMEGRDG